MPTDPPWLCRGQSKGGDRVYSGTAIDVDLVIPNAKRFHEAQHHGGECPAPLKRVDIGGGHAGALQRLFDGKRRSDQPAPERCVIEI